MVLLSLRQASDFYSFVCSYGMVAPRPPAYDIERYLNIRSASEPSFGPDGQLACVMDTAGVPQAWRLDAPGAWPEQLTFHEEAVGFADFSPTRDELVFGNA